MRATFILRATKGPQAGRVFEFDRHDMFMFGRSEDCQCSIPDDPYISANHFLLEVNPPEAELRDLGSKNGTHVNSVKRGGRDKGETPDQGAGRSKPVALRRGDRIKAGTTEFSVDLKLFEECAGCSREVPVETPHDEAKGGFLCETCSQGKPSAAKARGKVSLPTAGPCGDNAAGAEGYFTKFLAGAIAPKAAEGETEFPGYAVEGELRAGGMGRVFVCRRESDNGRVAVKCIKAHGRRAMSKQIELFKREMQVSMGLRHPNIVEFLEQGRTEDGAFFFAMEFCDGGSVSDLMDKKGRLSLEDAVPIMLQALEGVAFAHGRKIVHRDLKPHNILLSGEGKARVAKVADFGLAKNFALAGLSGMTASGQGGGTLVFTPKEQLKDFRSVRPVSDVFSMGATLYHMLTGKFVYDLDAERDLCAVILKDKIIPIRERASDLPEAVADAVDRATAPAAGDRFQTVGEFRAALAAAMD